MPKGIYIRTEKAKENMSKAHIGKSWGKHTEESKAKIGKANSLALSGKKRKPLSEETKRKISISNSKTHKEKWSKIGKEERCKMLEKWIKAGCSKNKDTSIEISVQNALKNKNIKFEKQKKVKNYYIDIFIPEFNIGIECDGDYWHNLPGRKESDEKRDNIIEQEGITIIRFPEHIIRKDVNSLINYHLKLFKVCSSGIQ